MKTLGFEEISQYIEALSSCAIEGNKTAQKLLELYRTNFVDFIKKVSEIHEKGNS